MSELIRTHLESESQSPSLLLACKENIYGYGRSTAGVELISGGDLG